MSDNDILLKKPILQITPNDAFEILGMQVNNDRSMIQMNYHHQIINMQNNDASKEDFAVHRVALEVLLRYVDNLKTSESNEISLNLDEEIDVSYLSEGIKYLAALQHLSVRILQAREREEVIIKENFVGSYEEAEDNMMPFDVGYPDEKEAKQLLKKIEALHVKNENGDYAGIMAEAYYQMTMVGTRTPKKNDLTWYQWLYDFASKAVKADNGPVKDAEYLFVCGYYLSQSKNKDSIRQAIAYLSEAENRVKGTFRERGDKTF